MPPAFSSSLHCFPASASSGRSLKQALAAGHSCSHRSFGCRSPPHALLAPRSGSRALSAAERAQGKGGGHLGLPAPVPPGGLPAAAGRPGSAADQLQGAVQTGSRKKPCWPVSPSLRLGPWQRCSRSPVQAAFVVPTSAPLPTLPNPTCLPSSQWLGAGQASSRWTATRRRSGRESWRRMRTRR